MDQAGDRVALRDPVRKWQEGDTLRQRRQQPKTKYSICGCVQAADAAIGIGAAQALGDCDEGQDSQDERAKWRKLERVVADCKNDTD